MDIVKAPNSEPIPGYRLVQPLGKGGFGEVWKCEAPGGLFKAIKFISSGDPLSDSTGGGAHQELQALQRIKTIRHPFLLSIERVEVIEDEVLIVMELADRSLHDLLTEYRAAGKMGIPRAELLSYLREAAEALDVLNQENGLLHLDVKPRNLFLTGRHVKVADFGLVTSLGDLQDPSCAMRRSETVTPLYAAPETFLGRFTLFSDQYSLAVAYQELRTGVLPFTGRNSRQLALRHVQDPPDLECLPESEKAIIARALAKEPRQRYPSCCAFVQALWAISEAPAPRPAPAHGSPAKRSSGERAGKSAAKRKARARVAAVSRDRSQTTPFPIPSSRKQTPVDEDGFLAGFQLLECLHRHAAGEAWRAQTSDGRKRLVKLINGYNAKDERPEGDPLRRLRDLQHPCLPSLEIQLGSGSRLALIAEEPDVCLADRLRECQQMGLPGVPRPELLVHLRQAAEALDTLHQQHRLQHLCLTPRQLVLRGGRLYLLDFALVELLWLPAGHHPAALNARYAAPELFDQQFSRHCDQYSLALIYQEMLTGIHAFRNVNQRQMSLARLRGKPDLGLLPAGDRPIVAQALYVDPDRRFPSCTAFVEALSGAAEGRGVSASSRCTQVQVATVPAVSPVTERCPPAVEQREAMDLGWDRPPLEMKQIIAEQVAAAAGDWEVRTHGPLRYRFHRGRRARAASSGERAVETSGPALEHFACGRLVPATLRLKLSSFQEEWKVQLVKPPGEDGTDSAGRIAHWQYHVHLRRNLWQRFLGRSPGLIVQIDLATPQASSEALTDVFLRVRPRDCSAKHGIELLEEVGPPLLRSLRDHLQLPPDRRGEERIDWVESVQVQPVYSESEIGEPFAARTKDISLGGLGLELPCRPPCDFLLVQICPPHRAPLSVPVQGLHAHSHGDGRHHLGTRFAWELVQYCSA